MSEMSAPGDSDRVPLPSACAAPVSDAHMEEAVNPPSRFEKPKDDINEVDLDEERMDKIRQCFAHKLKFFESEESSDVLIPKVLDDLSIESVIKYIQTARCKNIITLAGAGISTSAGIPDFRSPGSGLYHNLQKYNLPDPQAIFDFRYFVQNPKPFFMLAKELFEGTYKPTPSHYFIRLLHEKGLLLRHYTQNIDTLERIAGLPEEMLIEAHGSFHRSHCVECKKEYFIDWKKHFAASYDIPICTDCPGVVKPDIVLFGEKLPDRFHECSMEDFDKCDLLIIMGSSLEVQPFASLIDRVPVWCPRLLINRERVGCEIRAASLFANLAGAIGLESLVRLLGGLQFDSPDNIRDVALLGNCDDGVQSIADKLGWGDELRQLVKMEHAKIDMQEAAALLPSTATPFLQPESL